MLDTFRTDILNNIPDDTCCVSAFLSAVISLTNEEINENIIVLSQHDFLQDRFVNSLKKFYPNVKISSTNEHVLITGIEVIDILQELGLAELDNGKFHYTNGCNEVFLSNDCCKLSYLKTAFLCVGKLHYNNNSQAKSKGYNLELVFSDYELADDVLELSRYLNLGLKQIKRGNNIVLYTKDSQTIIEFLVKMGGSNEAFELQNNLVMREMRNDANRKGNCFDANLNKTINASSEQVKAIDYIISTYGLDYLDENLQEIALLRLSNPEATLSELRQLYPTQITRAGLKYKLDKILAIYKDEKK